MKNSLTAKKRIKTVGTVSTTIITFILLLNGIERIVKSLCIRSPFDIIITCVSIILTYFLRANFDDDFVDMFKYKEVSSTNENEQDEIELDDFVKQAKEVERNKESIINYILPKVPYDYGHIEANFSTLKNSMYGFGCGCSVEEFKQRLLSFTEDDHKW